MTTAIHLFALTRPGMDSPRSRWLQRLLMVRVAEQFGRNEMALHLLGELTTSASELALEQWEPALLAGLIAIDPARAMVLCG